MNPITQLIARYNAWRYDISNILKTFQRTQRQLTEAIAHHNAQSLVHSAAVIRHEKARAASVEQAAHALSVRDKIQALIN